VYPTLGVRRCHLVGVPANFACVVPFDYLRISKKWSRQGSTEARLLLTNFLMILQF
jgi:hypothetical protein